MTTITVADVITEFGNYYINEGQSANDIYKIRNFNFGFQSFFTRRTTANTRVKLAHGSISKLLQPWQKGFTPIGNWELKPHSFDLDNMKVDLEFCPDDLKDMWASFFLSDTTLDRTKFPFIRWVMEQYVRPQVEEDLELDASYSGVTGVVVAGTAGLPSESMNGFKKKIEDYVTAGDIAPIATGALSTTPVTLVDQIEDFIKNIDIRYRRANMTLAMNQVHYQNFLEGNDEKYNVNHNRQNSFTTLKYFPNIKVEGHDAIGASDKIFCTPQGNAGLWTKGVNMLTNWEIEKGEPRQVRIYNDGYMGVDLIQPQLLFTNELA